MPTIIDSLIVTLGLDDKKFKQGSAQVQKDLKKTGDEATKTGKKLNEAGKDGAKGFGEASNGLSKFLAAMAGAAIVKNFVTGIVQTNAELFRFSRNLQQNAQDISAWGNAIEITGGNAKAFQGTLSMLSKEQTNLQMTGQSNLIPFFSRFNVAMVDMNGNARKGTDMLLDLSDRMKGMDRTTAYNTLQAMGIDEGTANAMLEGRQSLEALIAAQKKQGAVTNEQAANAEKSRRAMKETEIQINAAKNGIVDGLNPALQSTLDLFKGLNEATGGWAATLITAVGGIGLLSTSLTGLARILGGLMGGGAAAAAGGGAAAAGGGLLRAVPVVAAGAGGYMLGSWANENLVNPGMEKATGEKGATLGGWLHDKIYGKGAGAEPISQAEVDALRKARPAAPAAGTPAAPAAKGDERQQFISAAAKQLGVPETAVEAQLRLETGKTGKSAIGAYNYGNIKAGKSWQGESVSRNVKENDASGKEYTENAAFRSYSSPEEAAKDYAKLIAKRFPQAVGATNATDFAQGLKSGGYATDPDYVSKIAKIAGEGRNVMAGIPGASAHAGGASASPRGGAGGNQVTTSIGEIKVYTQAKDADGIARDLKSSINAQFPAQANSGLS